MTIVQLQNGFCYYFIISVIGSPVICCFLNVEENVNYSVLEKENFHIRNDLFYLTSIFTTSHVNTIYSG